MTRDEIIKLAREAGWGNLVSIPHINALERFAALIAAAEREACAKACDEAAAFLNRLKNDVGYDEVVAVAAAIRARSQA